MHNVGIAVYNGSMHTVGIYVYNESMHNVGIYVHHECTNVLFIVVGDCVLVRNEMWTTQMNLPEI